jgi:aspartate-semialdehyde dehydrogenase
VYKIAIAGASTLVGRELKEALSESPLAASNFTLLDEEEAQGQLDQVGDEITFVQAIAPDTFDHIDFTFFCGSEDLTRKHWRDALPGWFPRRLPPTCLPPPWSRRTRRRWRWR